MTTRQILNFALAFLCGEESGIVEIEAGKNYADYFKFLADDCETQEGEYFFFHSYNANLSVWFENFFGQKYADIELPTEDGGYYYLFRISD